MEYSELNKLFVPYYRVSSEAQGKSGLGLRGQKDFIEHFFTDEELDDHEFIEVQSAKNIKDRPELKLAVQYCKDNNKFLCVAMSDRLSRNVEDAIWLLTELDGRLYACDIPTRKGNVMDKYEWVNKINFAERERELNSIRTKRGLSMSTKPKGRNSHKEWSEYKQKKAALKTSQTMRQNLKNNEAYQRTLNYIEKRVNELTEQGYPKYDSPVTGKESMFKIIAVELNDYKFERSRKNAEHTEYSTRKSFYGRECRKKEKIQLHDLSKELRLRRRKSDEDPV